MKGFVYFVSDGGYAIKVGYATSVERRLTELQHANARPLKLLGAVAGEVKHEKSLHRLLKPHHSLGEWFVDCVEVRQVVDSTLRDGVSGLNVGRVGRTGTNAPRHNSAERLPNSEVERLNPDRLIKSVARNIILRIEADRLRAHKGMPQSPIPPNDYMAAMVGLETVEKAQKFVSNPEFVSATLRGLA
jgi:hypothetical protein